MFSKIRQLSEKVLALANYDFCPNANRYAYLLKKPVVWVSIGIVVSLAVGLLLGPQGYVLALAFLALLVLGLMWPWLSMKCIKCELVLPSVRAWEDQEVNVVFRVKNYWPLTIFGLIVEGDFLQDFGEDDECVAFALRRVPAWSETEFSIPVTPQQRGQLPNGNVRVKNGFPFGLVDIEKPVTRNSSLLVWPACQRLDGQPSAIGTQLNIIGVLKDQSGNEGETIGVRSYQHGDRLRNVHWAQTVRSQNLMVRERQQRCATLATVILDLTAQHHAGRGIHSSYEWAIRLAGTICYQLHQNRSPIRLTCLGLSTDQRHSVDNHYGIEKVMDFLACLPTFSAAQPVMESTTACSNPSFETVGNTFLIGTSHSVPVVQKMSMPQLQPVIIDLEKFTNQVKPADTVSVAASKLSNILITTPKTAMNQFAAQWTRRYSGVAS